MAGDIEGWRADLEAAQNLAVGNTDALLRFRINYSDTLHHLGLYDESIRVAEEGIRQARELGVERTTGAILSSNAVEPLFARGDWGKAGALLDRNLVTVPAELFPRLFAALEDLVHAVGRGRCRRRGTCFGTGSPCCGNWQRWKCSHASPWRCSLRNWRGCAGTSPRPGGRLPSSRALISVRFPGYDLPLLAVAARILAARRSAGDNVGADAERELRGILLPG